METQRNLFDLKKMITSLTLFIFFVVSPIVVAASESTEDRDVENTDEIISATVDEPSNQDTESIHIEDSQVDAQENETVDLEEEEQEVEEETDLKDDEEATEAETLEEEQSSSTFKIFQASTATNINENILLKAGDSSQKIKNFKEDLTAAGFTPWTNPNEDFGPETVEYVQNFQSYYGLPVTGQGDEATVAKLSEVLNSPYQLGNRSPEIQEIKNNLQFLGFADHWNIPNANYGPETVDVVKAFQTQHGLVANGIVDAVTFNKIEEVINAPLSLGMRRPDAKEFKEDLTAAGFTPWTNPNDNFGPETVEYVQNFQSYYGLPVTGQADEATVNKLVEVLNSPYQLGNRSPEIQEIKNNLQFLGFADHWNIPNNNYGPETVKVVKDFQTDYGLVANGIVDEVTYEKIDGLVNAPLTNGSVGLSVQVFKEDLTAAGFTTWTFPNRNYGPETVEYVKGFQSYYGLPVTGNGDDATLSKLTEVLNSPYQSGNSSAEIQQVKTQLKTLGFATHWNIPNNDYGPETIEVVENFQSYYGLNPNGIIDSVTKDKIDSILNNPYQSGNSSSEIRDIKTDLMHLGFTPWTNPNGDYGPETVEVVEGFQSYYGLIVNGIVDEVTYAKIEEMNSSPLSNGLKRPDVKGFKADLTAAGFTSWTSPNDYYGPETVKYVKDFQTYYGLEVTGNGDDATLSKLSEVLNSPYQSGNSSAEIQQIKTQLKTLGFADHWNIPNNDYGPETIEVVENFQSYYGLNPNGMIDSVTKDKIDSILNSPYQSGNSSSEIRDIKTDLMHLGFTPWTNPNEDYGPETVEVVEEFQSHYGLVENGIVDSVTKEQINKILNSPYQSGNNSTDIQKIKSDLKTLGYADHWNVPNNNYGPETVEVVKNFQKDHNLPVNGIVDEVTFSMIAVAVKDYNNRKITVYLDPGHGGSESGTAHYGIVEKDLNLSISLKIRDRLESQGYDVVMSRTTDKTVGLYDRPAEANAIDADIFVSVHNNAMPGSSRVHGIETYYYQYDLVDTYKPQYPVGSKEWLKATSPIRDEESEKLAEAIHGELIDATNANDRGTKEMGFAVIRETFMPGVLLELGYVSNYNEANKLNTNWYQNALADATVQGINQYFGR